MHQHLILLNAAESRLLRDQYAVLLTELNRGKQLRSPYLAALKQTMQNVLNNQPGLENFWQQVKKNPEQYYHLHLVHEEKELLNLPWQLAIDENIYPQLYISKSASLVQSLDTFIPHAGPLKILIMVSSPEDTDIDHRLSYEEEEERILNALAPLLDTAQVQVDFTENGSLAALQQKLGSQYYHILYFTGHGSYRKNTGYLLMEDKDTLNKEMVTAEQFGNTLLLKPEHKPALIILASCQTAEGNAEHGFRGVADELIHVGIPAVIAMAFSVRDDYATAFASTLFSHLSEKEPLLVAYGKALKLLQSEEQQVLNHSNPTHSPVQWLIPQLYCNQAIDAIADWQLSATTVVDNRLPENFHFLSRHHSHYQFIGRRRECAQLLKKLRDNKPVLLKGQGGVGKTSLAEHLVKRLMILDPRYYCFAFNETTIGIDNMISRLQDFLEKQYQYSCKSEMEMLETAVQKLNFLVHTVTTQCKLIWVFDNIESCQQDAGGQLKGEYKDWFNFTERYLLNEFPVIFTGRYPIQENSNIEEHSLNQVSFSDFYLKCFQLSIRSISLVDQQLTLYTIARLLYNAYGGNYRIVELFDELYKEQPHRTHNLLKNLKSNGEQPGKSSKASKEIAKQINQKLANDNRKLLFKELLHLLDETSIYTLQLLSCFRQPVTIAALKIQKAGIDFEKAVKQLHNITLIEEQPDIDSNRLQAKMINYYYVTPFVKNWLENEPLPDFDFNHEQAGKYYDDACKQINDRDIENLREAFWHYSIVSNAEEINKVGVKLTGILYGNSLFREVLQYGSVTERIVGGKTDVLILQCLGYANQSMGKFDTALAYFKKVHSISVSKKDKSLEATILNDMGQAYLSYGESADGLKQLKKSLAIWEKLNNNVIGKCRTLNSMAVAYTRLGKLKEAKQAGHESLAIARKEKHKVGECAAMGNLAEVYHFLKDQEEAKEYYENCLSLAEEIGYKQAIIPAMFGLAMHYKEDDEHEMALEYFNKCLIMARKIGDKNAESKTLTGVAPVYASMGNRIKALRCAEESVSINRQIKDKGGLAAALVNLSQLYFFPDGEKKVMEYMNESLSLCKETKNIQAHISGLINLGVFYGGIKEDRKTALKYFTEGLELNKEAESKFLEDHIRKNMALINKTQGDNTQLQDILQENANQKRTTKDYVNSGITYSTMAIDAHKKGDISSVIKYLSEAFDNFNAANNDEGIYKTGKELGTLLLEESKRLPMSIVRGDETDRSRMMNKAQTILEQCRLIGHKAGYKGVGEIEKLLKRFKPDK